MTHAAAHPGLWKAATLVEPAAWLLAVPAVFSCITLVRGRGRLRRRHLALHLQEGRSALLELREECQDGEKPRDRDGRKMRWILNVLWLVLAGFWMFLGYMVVSVLWCLTILGIPFGVAAFRIGRFALWPFGRTIVDKRGAGVGSVIGNAFWIVLSGLWLAIGHAVTGALLCITVIGIPLGLANFKMIPISLFPLGKDIVPIRA